MKPKELDSISRMLVSRGVPRNALHTTSKLEGYTEFHKEILAEDFYDDRGTIRNRIFQVKPSRFEEERQKNLRKTMLIFDLYLKECLLAKLPVGRYTLCELYRSVRHPDSFGRVEDRGYSPFIFIPDFCVRTNYPPPTSDRLAAQEEIEWYLTDKIVGDNIGVVLFTIAPICKSIGGNWSERFIELLTDRAITHVVAG